MKKNFEITVTCTVPKEELNYNDVEQWPDKITTITVEAENEEKALDYFHETYPIKVLDDFDITIKKG